MKDLCISEARSYASVIRIRRGFAEGSKFDFTSGWIIFYDEITWITRMKLMHDPLIFSIFIGIALNLHTRSSSPLLSFTETPSSLDHTKCPLIAVSKYTALVVIQELDLEFHTRRGDILADKECEES